MAPLVGTTLVVIGAYLAIGLVVGVAFVVRGVDRIDPSMRGSPRSVRILILPGSVALWPLIAAKWIGAPKHESGHA